MSILILNPEGATNRQNTIYSNVCVLHNQSFLLVSSCDLGRGRAGWMSIQGLLLLMLVSLMLNQLVNGSKDELMAI